MADNNNLVDEHILKDSLTRTIDLIKVRITDIDTRQTELKILIDNLNMDVDQMRLDIDLLVNTNVPAQQGGQGQNPLTKWNVINNMRRTMNESLQLINNFYNTHKEYEAVKIRYIKENDDMSLSSHKMLMIDLKKLNNFSEDYNTIMYDITKLINSAMSKVKDVDISTDKTTYQKEAVEAKKKLDDLLIVNEKPSYDL